jgi:hypothetical protein
MNRTDLINRLVARKLANGNARAFCICLATPAKKLCFAAAKQPTANPKN